VSHVANVKFVTVSPRVWNTKIACKIAEKAHKPCVTVFARCQTVTVNRVVIVALVAKKRSDTAEPQLFAAVVIHVRRIKVQGAGNASQVADAIVYINT
jgi:hypothetical protein